MKTLKISYNPYKMETSIQIDKIDVCKDKHYDKFKEFIENKIPLQTWMEPIEYQDWMGIVNEVSDPEINDEVKVIFSGRKIDFEDLKRSIAAQNKKRSDCTKVIYHFEHKKILNDNVLSQNIDEVVTEIKSDRFRELIEKRTTEGLSNKYDNLEKDYEIAKEKDFYIVIAGVYSAGKSTLLNSLIRHSILPTSSRTCTSKNCRIRHNSSLGGKVTLTCFDENDNVVVKKQTFDNDEECAAAFLNICPIQDGSNKDEHPEVSMMEIGADLSHLYPQNVKDDKFNIVLIDTPGMDSAHSSDEGTNKHAEIALEAISMESKPMIVLCVDGQKYEDKSIGEFMFEIIEQTREEGIGFNDRFMFLMNKSDSISYKQNESPVEAKEDFARYLTDDSKWNIDADEEELRDLAESASHFVPRIFMTAARPALAIQSKVVDTNDDELDDEQYDLKEEYEAFKKKILGTRRPENYHLLKYCDNPDYRKDELEEEFNAAVESENNIRATELQSGLVSVEVAIKDYIERYAYPIKVRDLLETFEDILEDVEHFEEATLYDIRKKVDELGKNESEGREVRKSKNSVKEKFDALKKEKEKIEKQRKKLNKIKFDSVSLKVSMGKFQAEIESDPVISSMRANKIINTGQKEHWQVEEEIKEKVRHIKDLFDDALCRTSKKVEEINKVNDIQIKKIFEELKKIVKEIEASGVLEEGKYDFTNTVFWKLNFSKINTDLFSTHLMHEVKDKYVEEYEVLNDRKIELASSRNIFKKIRAAFMSEYVNKTELIDGSYDVSYVVEKISKYLKKLNKESILMQDEFEKVTEESKDKVNDLLDQLTNEIHNFLEDIKAKNELIEKLGCDSEKLAEERDKMSNTLKWLNDLKNKIVGV